MGNALLPSRVNQDTLKTRKKCLDACRAALASGRGCVIDNTNPAAKTRREFLEVLPAKRNLATGHAAGQRSPTPARLRGNWFVANTDCTAAWRARPGGLAGDRPRPRPSPQSAPGLRRSPCARCTATPARGALTALAHARGRGRPADRVHDVRKGAGGAVGGRGFCSRGRAALHASLCGRGGPPALPVAPLGWQGSAWPRGGACFARA